MSLLRGGFCVWHSAETREKCNDSESLWLQRSCKHLHTLLTWSLWMKDSTALSLFLRQAHRQAFTKWQPQHSALLDISYVFSLSLTDRPAEETWPQAEDHARSQNTSHVPYICSSLSFVHQSLKMAVISIYSNTTADLFCISSMLPVPEDSPGRCMCLAIAWANTLFKNKIKQQVEHWTPHPLSHPSFHQNMCSLAVL